MTPPVPIDSARHAQRLRWARQTLGLAGDDSQARRKFLERLEDEELIPPEDLVQAWKAIEEQSQGLIYLEEPAGFKQQDADQLETDVDAFAREFFTLELRARIARYGELYDRALHALKARGRLKLLARALKLDAAALLQGRLELQQELGRWLCELFVASPLDRPKRRAEMLREIEPQRAAWGLAARQLKKQLPAVAALDRALIAQISVPAALPPLEHYEELRETGYVPGAGVTIRQMASRTFLGDDRPQMPVVKVRSSPTPVSDYFDWLSHRLRQGIVWIFAGCVVIVMLSILNAPRNYPKVPSMPPGFPSEYDEAKIREAMKRLREGSERMEKDRLKDAEDEKKRINSSQPGTPNSLEDLFKPLPPKQPAPSSPGSDEL